MRRNKPTRCLFETAKRAAETIGISAERFIAETPNDLEAAFKAMKSANCEAVYVMADPVRPLVPELRGWIGLSEVKTAIFLAFGRMRWRNCSVFGVRSSYIFATPVMLPPGCAKLLTKPDPIGSEAERITIGIVDVALCKASIAGVVSATMTSGFKLTTSFARSGKRL